MTWQSWMFVAFTLLYAVIAGLCYWGAAEEKRDRDGEFSFQYVIMLAVAIGCTCFALLEGAAAYCVTRPPSVLGTLAIRCAWVPVAVAVCVAVIYVRDHIGTKRCSTMPGKEAN